MDDFADAALDFATSQVYRDLDEMLDEHERRGGSRDEVVDFALGWALAHPTQSVLKTISAVLHINGREAAKDLLEEVLGSISDHLGQADLALRFQVIDVTSN